MRTVVLALLVLVLAACGGEDPGQPAAAAPEAPAGGAAAPAEASAEALEAYRGEPLLVNVWASWCPKCRSIAAEYAEFVAANPDITFVGLDILDERDAAVGFLEEYAWAWPQ